MNETQTKITKREVRRWQRMDVDEAAWNDALDYLASGAWTLFGLWGEVDRVHLAAIDQDCLRILTVAAKDGAYPSVAAKHPPATRLERMIHDLFGLRGIGAVDQRPWIDHGRWGLKHPLGAAIPAILATLPYQFSPVEGSGLHQVRRWASSCRDHRTGALPVHGERRDGGAARRTSRLRTQGH